MVEPRSVLGYECARTVRKPIPALARIPYATALVLLIVMLILKSMLIHILTLIVVPL